MKLMMGLTGLLMGCLIAPTAFPQGRGGGGGRGQGGRQGQSGQPGYGQGQGNEGRGMGQGERKQSRLDAQQRKQVRSCENVADGARKEARTMARTSAKNFNAEQAREQRNRLREQVQTMERQHQQAMSGLDATQTQEVQEQVRNMSAYREQLRVRFEAMDRELAATAPDPARVREEARQVERIMSQWRDQYRTIAGDPE